MSNKPATVQKVKYLSSQKRKNKHFKTKIKNTNTNTCIRNERQITELIKVIPISVHHSIRRNYYQSNISLSHLSRINQHFS